jgi:rRNA maturation endonuclease Nob1
MSQNGKGSKDRTTNFESYRETFDSIFSKPEYEKRCVQCGDKVILDREGRCDRCWGNPIGHI